MRSAPFLQRIDPLPAMPGGLPPPGMPGAWPGHLRGGESIRDDRHNGPPDPGPSSEFHRWPLPGYLWPALERRTRSIFCTEPHLRLHGSLTPDIEAWVSRSHGRIDGLWLYRRHGRVARVLNEVTEIDAHGLQRFAHALFSRYRGLDLIELHAVALPDVSGVRGLQRAAVSEDFVLDLPASVDAWHASLSARTREKLRQARRRAERHQPAPALRLLRGAEIGEPLVREILQLGRARMRAKGRAWGMAPADEQRLCALLRERGLVALIEIDGRPCAGLLCTLAGRDLYMHVIAHDPALDRLRLGTVCCALCIEAAIGMGLERFHFLWGWYDYKQQLGGRHRTLHHALLWRGPMAALRHPWRLLRQCASGCKGRLRERRLMQRLARRRATDAKLSHPAAHPSHPLPQEQRGLGG